MRRILLLILFVCAGCISHTQRHAWLYSQPTPGQWLVQEVDESPIKDHAPPGPIRAFTGKPTIPGAWSYTLWAFDPANTSTCASDSNNCTQTACGAAGSNQGPCKTYTQIALGRWGTYEPLLSSQTLTVVKQMSSQPDYSDPIIMRPVLNNSTTDAVLRLDCTLPTPTARTITVSASKNRSTNTLWTLSGISHGLSSNLINDTTANSWFWHWKVNDLSTDFASQPVRQSIDNDWGGNHLPTEIAIVTNDAANEYTDTQLVQSNIVELNPIMQSNDSGLVDTYVEVQHCNGWALNTPNNGDGRTLIGNSYVWLHDTYFTRRVYWRGDSLNNTVATWGNVYFQGGIDNGVPASDPDSTSGHFMLYGGVVSTPNAAISHLSNVTLTGDTLIGDRSGGSGHVKVKGGTVIGEAAYLDTNAIVVETGLFRVFDATGQLSGPFIWGNGGVNVDSTMTYPSGSGKAAAVFLTSGSLQLLGQSKSCIEQPGAVATTFTCNISVSASTLDSNGGTTSNCLAAGPAAICNFGP